MHEQLINIWRFFIIILRYNNSRSKKLKSLSGKTTYQGFLLTGFYLFKKLMAVEDS